MAHHISQLESELQNIPEAAPKAFGLLKALARASFQELRQFHPRPLIPSCRSRAAR